MRIYNITTEGQFSGMYISEYDSAEFITAVSNYANIYAPSMVTAVGNYVVNALQQLYTVNPYVVMNLGTVRHGNQNCVRLMALCAILAQVLSISDTEVMKIVYEVVDDWEEIEIETGGVVNE